MAIRQGARLFVYGTLMPDQRFHPLIRADVHAACPALARGLLLDLENNLAPWRLETKEHGMGIGGSEGSAVRSARENTTSWTAGRWISLAAVAVVSLAAFFVGLRGRDFIKTEALRTIVVKEMLERPGLHMPTVHHRPYLKKPPLFAWTTATLSRWIGRLNEQAARLPSGILAACLVFLLFAAGETFIGRGAGLVAAALTLANVIVLDYGMRAELDMGFTFFCTGSMLCVWLVLRAPRWATPAWLGCYLFAILAAFWKAPHSLIFLWLTLLSYGFFRRRWRWLLHPAQIAGLLIALGLLGGWTVALSDFAGGGQVGRTAGIELFSRLIPHKFAHLWGMALFPFMVLVVTLPASLFVLAYVWGMGWRLSHLTQGDAGVDESVDRPTWNNLVQRLKRQGMDAWTTMIHDPFAEFLLFWAVPNLVFQMLTPAKAARYTLPLFAPIILLGAWAAWRGANGTLGDAVSRAVNRAWLGIRAALALGAAGGWVMGFTALIAPGAGGVAASAFSWFILGAGWLAAAVILGAAGRRTRGGDCNPPGATTASETESAAGRMVVARPPVAPWVGSAALLVAVAAAKPAIVNVWWPIRVESDSCREIAEAIDGIVPAGQPVYVLGKRELSTISVYSQRAFVGVAAPFGDDGPSAPAQPAPGVEPSPRAGSPFYIARESDVEDYPAGLRSRMETVKRFERGDESDDAGDDDEDAQTAVWLFKLRDATKDLP